jgi:hypothetical protein
MKAIIFVVLIMLILCSCKRDKTDKYEETGFTPVIIYKIRDTSYFNYFVVKANDTKTKIVMTPGYAIGSYKVCIPETLVNQYYYEPSFRKKGTECYFAFGGIHAAVTDVKVNDYVGFNSDTMLNHIISFDPFLEYYREVDSFVIMSNTTFDQDTAKLNNWIRKGELGKHLTRIK